MTIGQPIARSSQDLFWLRLTGYSEHWTQRSMTRSEPYVAKEDIRKVRSPELPSQTPVPTCYCYQQVSAHK
jgi:hypothetical protein